MTAKKSKVQERRRKYLEFIEQLAVREDDVMKEPITDLLPFVFPEHFTKSGKKKVGLGLNAAAG
jgi:hypothetical protein